MDPHTAAETLDQIRRDMEAVTNAHAPQRFPEVEANLEALNMGATALRAQGTCALMFCRDCCTYGTPLPHDTTCGNCGSSNVRRYIEIQPREEGR